MVSTSTGPRSAPPGAAGGGDADIAAVAALIGEPARAKIMLCLLDGRAQPASALADAAGVSAPAASAHLKRLVQSGLLTVEPSGRHRYFRLADERIAAALEALALIAPRERVNSLSQHSRARTLRRARTCYDHLAGELGSDLTAALLESGALSRADGVRSTSRRPEDRYSAPTQDHPYLLGPRAAPVLADLGVDLDRLQHSGHRRPLLRFCVDWTEQRHHLAGRLGAELATALFAQGWIRRGSFPRAVIITEAGNEALADLLARAATG